MSSVLNAFDDVASTIHHSLGGGGEAGSRAGSASSGYRRFGKITFVDLAGSERLKQTGNTAAGAVWETVGTDG
jgi:hypothetical protein